MEAVAVVQIALLPDGSIQVEAKGQINPLMLMGLLEKAKLLAHEQQSKPAQAVQAPPPQIVGLLNGKHR